MTKENISLRFKSGSSDKAYKAALIPVENEGYLVNFAYGRYGGPYKTGTKTAKPLPYSQAKLAYDKLVAEKMAKGYTTDTSGKPFESSVMAPDRTNYLPQLLNPIESEDCLEALTRAKGTLGLQIKHDGERRIVVVNRNEIYGSNRRGLRTALNPEIVEALGELYQTVAAEQLVFDAEDMGDHLVIFDVLQWHEDITSFPFSSRANYLWLITQGNRNILRIDEPIWATTINEVHDFLIAAQEGNAEGIVLRDPDAPYTPGRPNSWGPCLKIKFYSSATCKVGAIHPTKRSISLELFSIAAQTYDNPFGNWKHVGNCTVPPNYDMPKIGELVEIKYLYAYEGGSLYQPQYKGLREDLAEDSASINQLRYY